jgi:chromosome segregation ATPase
METEIGFEIVLMWIKSNWFYLTFLGGIGIAIWKLSPMAKAAQEIIHDVPAAIDGVRLEIKDLKRAQDDLVSKTDKAEDERRKGAERMQNIQNDLNEVKEIQQKLCTDTAKAEEKRVAGAERTELILKALKASLEAIRDGESDGNVTGAINDLEEYMRKKAST